MMTIPMLVGHITIKSWYDIPYIYYILLIQALFYLLINQKYVHF